MSISVPVGEPRHLSTSADFFRTLKSGGYIVLSELATTPKATNPQGLQPLEVFRWLELLSEAMKTMGLNMRVAPSFKEMLIEAGFVDVTETKFEYPWGPWPEDRRMKAIGFWHVGMFPISSLGD